MRNPNLRRAMMAIVAFALAVAVPVHAAQVSFSATAPTLGTHDQGNTTGASAAANNVAGGDANATYIASDRPVVGQTFTTGNQLGGYQLAAITLRQVTYSTFALVPDLNYTIRITRPINSPANTLEVITSETANVPQATSGNIPTIAGGGFPGLGSGRYVTFTFATPVGLAANTTYGFDVGAGASPTHYWETDGASTDRYAGGTAYSSGTTTPNGVGNTGRTSRNGDHVFVVKLLTANTPVVTQPTISPSNAVYAGTPVTLRVVAAGAAPLHYQWRANNGSGPVAISGANSTNLPVNTAPLLGDYAYDVVVTNSSGSVTSAPVVLTVFDASAPIVTTDTTPSSPVRYTGQRVTFTAAFDGTRPISYQWQKDLEDIPGATNTSITISNLQVSDSVQYSLRASNSVGVSSSSLALLEVIEAPSAPPPGTYPHAVLTNGPIAYWRLNDPVDTQLIYDSAGPYNAANNGVSLSVPGLGLPDFPGFPPDNTAAAFNGGSSANTGASIMNGLAAFTLLGWFNSSGGNGPYAALFGQNDALELGYNDEAGVNLWIQLGGNWVNPKTTTNGFAPGQWYLVAVVADATNAYIYINGVLRAQQSGGAPSASSTFGFNIGGGGIFGESGDFFNGVLEDIAVFDKAISQQRIQDLYGVAAGAGAPSILGQPISQTLYPGRTARFTATGIGGTRPLSYQWQRAGANLSDGGQISGAKTNSVVISNVSAGNAGPYRLIITNASGSITSAVATLTVVQPTGTRYETNAMALNPLAYWRLNETGDPSTGTNLAHDYFGGHAGVYGVAAQNGFNGISGPRPSDGFSIFENGNSALHVSGGDQSGVTVPPLNLNSDTVSFTMWIKPSGPQADYTGLFITRSASTEAGIGYGGAFSENAGQLIYTWNGNSTWTFPSGLMIPSDVWSFIAVVIEPSKATLYLYNAAGRSASANLVDHISEIWNGPARIGGDPAQLNRNFNGQIDEVAVFRYALTPAQILQLYTGAPGVTLSISYSGPNVILGWPRGTLQEALTIDGEWNPVSGAVVPSHTNSAAGPHKFYRVLTEP